MDQNAGRFRILIIALKAGKIHSFKDSLSGVSTVGSDVDSVELHLVELW